MYARTSLFSKRFVRPVPLIEPELRPYSSNNLFTAKPYTLKYIAIIRKILKKIYYGNNSIYKNILKENIKKK